MQLTPFPSQHRAPIVHRLSTSVKLKGSVEIILPVLNVPVHFRLSLIINYVLFIVFPLLKEKVAMKRHCYN